MLTNSIITLLLPIFLLQLHVIDILLFNKRIIVFFKNFIYFLQYFNQVFIFALFYLDFWHIGILYINHLCNNILLIN